MVTTFYRLKKNPNYYLLTLLEKVTRWGLERLLSPQLLCFNTTQVENASQKYLRHLHLLQLCGTARDVARHSCCHRLANSLCDTQQLLEAVC